MRRQPLDSLATKIILFVFLSTFLTALAVSWISIQSTHSFLRRRIDHALPATAERAALEVADFLSSAMVQITVLANGRDVRAPLQPLLRAGTADEAARSGFERELQAVFDRSRHLDGIAVLGPDGRLIAQRGRARELPATVQEETASAPAASLRAVTLAGGRVVPLSHAPLLDDEGRRLGTLLGWVDLEGMRGLLAGDRNETSGFVSLVDDEGRVVARSPADGRGLEERVPMVALTTGKTPEVREYTNASGERLIASARGIGTLDWFVLVEEPFSRAFEPVVSVVTRLVVIDLGIIFLFSFLAYQITAAIVRPIEALSEGARRISQGHLDVEIPEARSQDELGLLTRTFNDMTRELRKNQLEIEAANQKLVEQNQTLQRNNEVLEQLSITDGLTKLHNHRFFQDHLTREMKRVTRNGEPLSILLIDIDDFKRLNDRLGHAAGDELLMRMSSVMNAAIRESDLLARYGGEEFAVVATQTDLLGALTLAEKVRAAVAETSYILDGSMRPTRVTVSIGVAQYKGDRKAFFQAADRALYRAKAEGKNRVRADEDISA